jgi:hypothetical protein
VILKTYTRIFSTDVDQTVALLQQLHGRKPHMRFAFGALDLVAIGDMLVVSGAEDALSPIRGSMGPWIVADLDQARQILTDAGARILSDIEPVPTGRMLYARHSDGSVVEYVQWNDDLIESFVEAPRRAGRLSSQI